MATVLVGQRLPNESGPTHIGRAANRPPLYRPRRNGIITQELSDPTSPIQVTGPRKLPLSMAILSEYSGGAPRPKTTDSFRGPRRRLYKTGPQIRLRSGYHPTLSGMERKILSSGWGSDPQSRPRLTASAQRLEEADAPTTRCLLK